MRHRLVVGTMLLGFVAGVALFGFIVGASLLGFVAVATSANAYTPGVGSVGVSHGTSISIHNSLSSSLGDSGRRDDWSGALDWDGRPAHPTAGKGKGVGTNGGSLSAISRRPHRAH